MGYFTEVDCLGKEGLLSVNALNGSDLMKHKVEPTKKTEVVRTSMVSQQQTANCSCMWKVWLRKEG